ncbi:hypothetical protein C8J57DRAFT_1722697 [Mycena rebaudengoi]|nr:hypothetical protein C8J57DRAFT_1722697 [Mycena rebaudengoi]
MSANWWQRQAAGADVIPPSAFASVPPLAPPHTTPLTETTGSTEHRRAASSMSPWSRSSRSTAAPSTRDPLEPVADSRDFFGFIGRRIGGRWGVAEGKEKGDGKGAGLSRPRGGGGGGGRAGVDPHRERTLTFSLITANVTWLLIISYHKIADVESGRLRAPPLFPEFASLDIAPALLERGNFRPPPLFSSLAPVRPPSPARSPSPVSHLRGPSLPASLPLYPRHSPSSPPSAICASTPLPTRPSFAASFPCSLIALLARVSLVGTYILARLLVHPSSPFLLHPPHLHIASASLSAAVPGVRGEYSPFPTPRLTRASSLPRTLSHTPPPSCSSPPFPPLSFASLPPLSICSPPLLICSSSPPTCASTNTHPQLPAPKPR